LKVAEDFPQFEKEAESIKRKAKQEYQKEYLEANPPTIIMNTKVDPNRVTRHDLIRRAGVRNQTVLPSKKSISSSLVLSPNPRPECKLSIALYWVITNSRCWVASTYMSWGKYG